MPDPQTTWQPIETAPRDKETIIMLSYGKVVTGFFYKGEWLSEHDEGHLEPTHWMPLPEKPL